MYGCQIFSLSQKEFFLKEEKKYDSIILYPAFYWFKMNSERNRCL